MPQETFGAIRTLGPKQAPGVTEGKGWGKMDYMSHWNECLISEFPLTLSMASHLLWLANEDYIKYYWMRWEKAAPSLGGQEAYKRLCVFSKKRQVSSQELLQTKKFYVYSESQLPFRFHSSSNYGNKVPRVLVRGALWFFNQFTLDYYIRSNYLEALKVNCFRYQWLW